MSDPQMDAVTRRLTARGIRVLADDERSPTMVISIVRENRRRYANSPRVHALGRTGSMLADDLMKDTGVAAGDIALVLAALSCRLGALAVGHGVSGPILTEITALAAEELDRRANGGDPG